MSWISTNIAINDHPHHTTDEMKLKSAKSMLKKCLDDGSESELISKTDSTDKHKSRGGKFRAPFKVDTLDLVSILQQANFVVWLHEMRTRGIRTSSSKFTHAFATEAAKQHKAARERRRRAQQISSIQGKRSCNDSLLLTPVETPMPPKSPSSVPPPIDYVRCHVDQDNPGLLQHGPRPGRWRSYWILPSDDGVPRLGCDGSSPG